ncbi:cilia- and flagella-associated protein 99 isoform X2 [Callorhinchus milii]|uniref:cilia- and flagella-associated protein 99 isoform X2 n=1 Tax=Callorhinchus milii TaxID=7868 RepID=UPI000457311F|nr:cilia- and flagella-associated protein 99 isoform X2 [Callorhinchus milii]|eukprot:gi/632974002/ref/XP_007903431.1/ PREDICTED: calponin homology domain-containing protein DDB_G0272472 isoform X2 [Callorhinchus milii]
MSMYSKLLSEVIHILDNFNPDNYSTDHFLMDTILEKQKTRDEAEKVFLVEVLTGCINYRPLLDIVVGTFFKLDGRIYMFSERNLFAVLCYLATFRIEELGLNHFSKFVNSQEPNKMYKFLRFFFDPLNLKTWITAEWCKVYEPEYVKIQLIEPLIRWQPVIQSLIDSLANIVNNVAIQIKEPKRTIPVEFNLTKPKPRAIPMPEKIPMLELQTKVPRSTYEPPKEMQLLQEIRKKNRQKAELQLIEANVNQFKCAEYRNSDRKQNALAEVIKDEEAMVRAREFKARTLPSAKMDNIPIRLNTTAILRESALYQRRVKEELDRINDLIEGARDPSEFLEWQRQKKEQESEEKMVQLERRRLEGKLNFEEAILSRHSMMQEKQKKAALQKEEMAELLQKKAEKQVQKERELKMLVDRVMKGDKTKQAQLKLKEYKKKLGQEINKESRERQQQALDKAEAEFKRKYDLICEIRAFENSPAPKHSYLDLTHTPGFMLHEMSFTELRERLGLLKEARAKAEEEKRGKIMIEKMAKEQLILDKLEKISLHRGVWSKKVIDSLVASDQSLAELEKKLKERKKERQKLTVPQKIVTHNEWSRLMRRKISKQNSIEEHHWQSNEESRERQAQLLKMRKMAIAADLAE